MQIVSESPTVIRSESDTALFRLGEENGEVFVEARQYTGNVEKIAKWIFAGKKTRVEMTTIIFLRSGGGRP